MGDWGNEMFVTPGIVVDGELVTTNLVDINLGIRILLGSSYYEDWEAARRSFVPKDPLGNPVDKRHPWNQTTIPKPQKRDLDGGNYSWVMSPRWYDKRTGDNLAMDTGGGALARLWATALANKVHIPFVNATGSSVQITLPKTPDTPEIDLEWKIPQWSNAIERDRARIYFVAYAAGCAFHFLDKAFEEIRAGRTKTFEDFDVPDEAIGCGFHEAVRGVLSHHMVIRDGKIANYHPYPPTPWNGSPTDSYGTPGPVRGRVQRHADLRGGRRGQLPRHRHHARGPLVRPVPAVRRAHVPRQRQDDQAGALADVRGARMIERRRGAARPGRGVPAEPQREVATELVQALLDMYGEGLSRIVAACDACRSRTSSSRTCCCCTGCTRCRCASGCAARWTRCARTWSRTAAASSCSASTTASCGCGWRARATAARPRR